MNWAEPADVVVVGYGPAGAAAAIAAHDAGARVVVVESAARAAETRCTAAGSCSTSPVTRGRAPRRAVLRAAPIAPCSEAYADGLHGLGGWLRGAGRRDRRFDPPPGRLPAPFPSWPLLPGRARHRATGRRRRQGRRGEALWDVLDAAVRERGIEVRFETRVDGW